jgi:acetylcholinesterase
MYNQVPLITGLTENEGGFFYIEWKYSGGLDMDTTFVTTQLDQVVRNITDLSEDVIPQATQLIYDYYFSDINLNSTRAIGTAMQELLSDALLNLGNQQLITLLPKGESDPSVYSYVLSYKGSQRLHKFIPWENIGVTHTDDLVYLFDLPIYRQLHHQDKTTSERMLTFWTTFAKTGNPNPASSDVIDITWERVTSNSTLDYLNIDTELSMQENFRNDRMQFWENCIMTLTPTSNGTCNAV